MKNSTAAEVMDSDESHNPDVFLCPNIPIQGGRQVFVSGSEKQERHPREDDANVDSLYVQ